MRPLPYDVIPNSMAIFNSTQTENYSEVVDINFAVQLDGDHNQLVIESCTKDYSWWEEAVKFADCMEMEDTSRMCNLVSVILWLFFIAFNCLTPFFIWNGSCLFEVTFIIFH